MTLELRSARSLMPVERAELFNRAYEGYLLPFHIDEHQLAFMDDAFDLDLDASRIAYRDGEPVGLGNLGLRGEDAWVGGVGVVPSARRSGVGEVADAGAARAGAGARRASRLARGDRREHGRIHALREARLPAGAGCRGLDAAGGRGRPQPDARSPPPRRRRNCPEQHEPWQRADGTLDHYDDVRGLVTDSGAMLFCVRATAQLQQYTGDPEPLLQALRTFGDVYVLNLPVDDPAAQVLRELGGSVVVRQHEMLFDLGH